MGAILAHDFISCSEGFQPLNSAFKFNTVESELRDSKFLKKALLCNRPRLCHIRLLPKVPGLGPEGFPGFPNWSGRSGQTKLAECAAFIPGAPAKWQVSTGPGPLKKRPQNPGSQRRLRQF